MGELDLAFLRATSPVMMEVAYATAAWAMRYLGETHGLPKLMLVLKGYATGATTEALFKQHLGQDMRAVEAGFEAWMNTRLDRTISGWQPSPRGKIEARDKLLGQAIVEIRAKDYTTAARTLQQLVQGSGDGYRPRMLLGEVLLQGPQWQSAAPHFEKARGFNREAIEPIIRLAELARRAGDVSAEKQRLREGLALDGMSFDPAARLTMRTLIADFAGRGGGVGEVVPGPVTTFERAWLGAPRQARRAAIHVVMPGEEADSAIELHVARLPARTVVVFTMVPEGGQAQAGAGFDLVLDSLAIAAD